MQYYSLHLQTLLLSPVTSTTGCYFCFGSVFILSGVISPLIFISLLGTYRPGEFLFQCSVFLPFPTVHGVLKAPILKWFAVPFSSGPHFVRTLHRLSWVALHSMARSFIELNKAVIHVIRLVSFCDCGFQSVCPLMVKDKKLQEAS